MAEKKKKRAEPKGRKKAERGLHTDRLDKGLRDAVGEAIDIMAPAVKHLLNAEKEVLLAVRAVLDKAIEKTEEMADRQERRKERARKVKIKVD